MLQPLTETVSTCKLGLDYAYLFHQTWKNVSCNEELPLAGKRSQPSCEDVLFQMPFLMHSALPEELVAPASTATAATWRLNAEQLG